MALETIPPKGHLSRGAIKSYLLGCLGVKA